MEHGRLGGRDPHGERGEGDRLGQGAHGAAREAGGGPGRLRAREDGGPQEQRGGAVQDARRPRLLPGGAVTEAVAAQRRVLEFLHFVTR